MNRNIMYGFPISSIFFQLCGMILIVILLIFTFLLENIIFTASIIIFMLIFWYIFIYTFNKRFLRIRKKILQQMINQATLKGDEQILDLGTGAGYIAIGFSKHLSSGKIVGVDKFDRKTSINKTNFFEEIKINFFGNTLEQAKKNASIEQRNENIYFVKSDLNHYFPFSDHSFNVILSSQFLYCIHPKNRKKVLSEIHRVLKPTGKLIFFESEKFINWDIGRIDDFFKKKKYVTQKIHLEKTSNKCIFLAKKTNKK
jgi:arsenite methyltransferase